MVEICTVVFVVTPLRNWCSRTSVQVHKPLDRSSPPKCRNFSSLVATTMMRVIFGIAVCVPELLLLTFFLFESVGSFQIRSVASCSIRTRFAKSSFSLSNENNNDDAAIPASSQVEEYRNVVTKILSNFMSSDKESVMKEQDTLALIDFNAPKLSKKIALETFAGLFFLKCPFRK